MLYQFETRYDIKDITHMLDMFDTFLLCSNAHITCEECKLSDKLCFTERNKAVRDAMYLLFDLLNSCIHLPHNEKEGSYTVLSQKKGDRAEKPF